jgi:hypothetical protein
MYAVAGSDCEQRDRWTAMNDRVGDEFAHDEINVGIHAETA